MFLQLLANGLIAGCAYALVALGFALIYNTTRTFHFAHGAVYTFTVYLFYTLSISWQMPLVAALPIALVLSALAGVVIDEMVYRPLVARRSSQLVQMLSSLGVYVISVNMIAMCYGNKTKELSSIVQPTYSFGGLLLSKIQLITALSFTFIFAVLFFVLHRTRLGKLIRAMRDDPALVEVMGINPHHIRLLVFGLGSVLAGLAAIITGLDVGIDPHIGMTATLAGAVALFVGGVAIFEGAALGGLVLGILQGLAVWQLSARWQETVTFLVLILFLLFRPEGILGARRRIEEVAR